MFTLLVTVIISMTIAMVLATGVWYDVWKQERLYKQWQKDEATRITGEYNRD